MEFVVVANHDDGFGAFNVTAPTAREALHEGADRISKVPQDGGSVRMRIEAYGAEEYRGHDEGVDPIETFYIIVTGENEWEVDAQARLI